MFESCPISKSRVPGHLLLFWCCFKKLGHFVTNILPIISVQMRGLIDIHYQKLGADIDSIILILSAHLSNNFRAT